MLYLAARAGGRVRTGLHAAPTNRGGIGLRAWFSRECRVVRGSAAPTSTSFKPARFLSGPGTSRPGTSP